MPRGPSPGSERVFDPKWGLSHQRIEEAAMDGSGKRVLVVDDDHHARFLLEALLYHSGYKVVPACDGRAALLELQKREFDAVITDYRMPFVNGIELLRQIQIQYPQIPVILASGSLP